MAEESSEYLHFIVESTKVGIFSSDVDGYVKDYSYSAKYDDKNEIIREMKIIFQVKSMDTDNESRDEKLHNLCMSHKKFPQVVLSVPGPLFLKGAKPYKYEGVALIRGKKKPFTIELVVEKQQNGKTIISGESAWSLKDMEISDPSIAVATLSDEIRIKIKIIE